MYHAKHRVARRSRFSVALLATAVLTGLTLGQTAPAQADNLDDLQDDSSLVVTADDSRSVGRCDFKVVSFDPSTGKVTAKLGAQARPKNLLLGRNNKAVEVICDVFGDAGDHLAQNRQFANGSRIARVVHEVEIRLSDGYELCASVATLTVTGQVHSASACDNSF